MGGAEDAVEAVRVGVNCPEERLEREGEQGASGAVRRGVCRDIRRRSTKQCMASETLKQKASKGDVVENRTVCRESLEDVTCQNKGEGSIQLMKEQDH